MNRDLMKKINSVNRSLRIITNCHKNGTHLKEETLELLVSDLTEVTATFNKLYEDIMEIITKQVDPN